MLGLSSLEVVAAGLGQVAAASCKENSLKYREPQKREESSGNVFWGGFREKKHESETEHPFVKNKKLRTKNKVNQTI